ncbi:uncharacterized protein LOC111861939 isoform X2 [Cryptotermes secundus]|uniref:uncharacterized protein LOC111861939 isoform X2 n=1 Tax=Cryptotermes secundus TaxID=105785 RepID=UPI000CD7DD7A|nr:uncharacterized protein LOC111861939 isoform X2 [Cryptotermes secundus]
MEQVIDKDSRNREMLVRFFESQGIIHKQFVSPGQTMKCALALLVCSSDIHPRPSYRAEITSAHYHVLLDFAATYNRNAPYSEPDCYSSCSIFWPYKSHAVSELKRKYRATSAPVRATPAPFEEGRLDIACVRTLCYVVQCERM